MNNKTTMFISQAQICTTKIDTVFLHCSSCQLEVVIKIWAQNQI